MILKRGEEIRRVMVRAYLSPDLTAAARRDAEYHMQTVTRYVFDRLCAGWTPDQQLPPLIILNPDPADGQGASRKRGLLGRLFGG